MGEVNVLDSLNADENTPSIVGNGVETVESVDTTSTMNIEQQEASQIEIDKNKGGAVQSALVQESFVGSLTNHAIDFGIGLYYDEDEKFMSNIGSKEEELSESGISIIAQTKILENAKNEQHYYVMLGEEKRQERNAKSLDNLGVEGVLYRVGAGISDVAVVSGVGAAVPNIAAKFVSLGTNTLQRIGLSEKASSYISKAVGGAGIEVGLETPKQFNTVGERDEVDLMISGVAGVVGGLMFETVDHVEDLVDPLQKNLNEILEGLDDTTVLSEAEAQVAKQTKDRTWFQKGMEKLQFDQTSRIEGSQSASFRAMNEGGEHAPLTYNPRFKTTDDYSAAEYNDMYKDTVNGFFTQTFTPLLRQFTSLQGKANIPLINRLDFNSQNEFFNYAGRVIRNLVDEEGLPKEMLDMHEQIRHANAIMSKNAYDDNIRLGHESFVNGTVARDDNYLPVLYNMNKVIREVDKGDYVKLIKEGLRNSSKNAGKVLDEAELEARATKWVNGQYDRAKAHNSNTLRGVMGLDNKIDSYEELFKDLIDNYSVPRDDAMAMAREGITEAPKGGMETSARGRTSSGIDLTASILKEDGTTLKLGDYVENNVDLLWKNYGESMGGDVALRKAGFNSRQDIWDKRILIEKELTDQGLSKNAIAGELATYDDLMKQFLGAPVVNNSDGLAHRSTSLMTTLARASNLGSAWIPMFAEVGAVTWESGVRNMFKLDGYKDFVNGYKGIESSDMLMEGRIFNGLGNGAYKHANNFLYDADHVVDPLTTATKATVQDRILGGVNKGLGGAKKLEEATFQMGGVKSLTSLLEQKLYTGTASKILKQVSKTGKIDTAFAKEMGWSDDVASEISTQIQKHAKIDGTSDDVFNFHLWDGDSELKFNLGMRRFSSVIVQKKLIGDKVGTAVGEDIVQNTVFGKLFTSLMDYTLTAHSKQLSRSLNNVDKQQITRNIASTAGAYLGYQTSVNLKYFDDDTKRREMLKPANVARGTFNMTTFGSMIPSVVDPIMNMATGEGLFRENSGGARGSVPLPAPLKIGNDIVEGTQGVMGLASDSRLTSSYQVSQLLNALSPNFIGVRQMNGWLADHLTQNERLSFKGEVKE